MLGTCVDFESCHGLSSDGVVGKHTADGKLHCLFGLCSHKGLVLDSLQTADIADARVIARVIPAIE